MPPKKRKAAAAASTRPKKVRIGSSSVIGDDAASEISASGRPKRSAAGEPDYNQGLRRSSSNFTTTVKPENRKSTSASSGDTKKAVTQTLTKKPVGRPRQTATHVEVPRPRDRPKATKTSASSTTNVSPRATGKRGRPKRAQADATHDLAEDSTGAVVHEAEWEDSGPEEEHELEDERQFWLMKAEPESRMEKGHDVKFSIDDLMNATEPEGWDGVRNAVARNNMRAMREGDLAFFYHSNCAIPGIAGIMQIAQEHGVDESAFDPNHPYYDPKSDRSKPKWELVHVVGMHKFGSLITLKDLKAHMGPGQPLENMQTLKQSRLSVSSVTMKEWNFIMDLSGEYFEDDT